MGQSLSKMSSGVHRVPLPQNPAYAGGLMPTEKDRPSVLFTDEELDKLTAIWEELRKVGRRRRPEYIGQKLTLGQWIARCALERATEIEAELKRTGGV